MKTEIDFLGNNTNGLKQFSINISIDKELDLVEKITGQNLYSEILDICIHNLSWNNTLSLNSKTEIEFPKIEFYKTIINNHDSFETERIISKTIKGLVEKIESTALKSLLNWNQDFIAYCLVNLFPDLRESILYKELSEYYLNNSITNNDYFPESLSYLFNEEKTKINLLNEILSNLEILKSFKFKPDNFKDEEFDGQKPTENFFNKLSGQYKSDLKKYEDLKKSHYTAQQAKKEAELQKIKNYVIITKEFSDPNIEIISERIKQLNSNKEINKANSENSEYEFIKLLDRNVINHFYNFNYELFLKNDYLILEIHLPSFEEFLNSKNKKISKTTIKDLENEYRDICISVFFGIGDLIFKNDNDDSIKNLFINGTVSIKDKSTGKQVQSCILSLSIPKIEFINFELNHIDLFQGFKRLKGISAPSFSESIPVRPIMTINKEDRRFVDGREVMQHLDERTNLASMDWEDFEHFIRELFEKEFSSSGGEVKITQSSRDGGIDAIAFDPDPIKGGKIVIQSKRYTNVVGVSAVRDLYGTMINEGANKGILVTTSHFGSDAYNFAKDKPLSLIDGDNLLQLLFKHNFKAKIDIREARENRNKG